MRNLIRLILLTLSFSWLVSCTENPGEGDEIIPIPDYHQPGSYICYRTSSEINIDGVINGNEWEQAAWSEYFRDIEGPVRPDPEFKTRMKMMWDDEYLYVAAELEEPHVWATITKRDEVIFYDNDFEVFIDPDGDTHAYYELEVNAFGTPWDLLLLQPYRDGGPAVDSWDIQGLKVGVNIIGTINDPSDTDEGWTLEIAIPFAVLEECAEGGARPVEGDQWRINFSRVEWRVKVKDGKYEKEVDPASGKPYPENNWVWSPQGYINMHMPEFWGFVQFAGQRKAGSVEFNEPPESEIMWVLRNLYYRQFQYEEENGRYAPDLKDLAWPGDDLLKQGFDVVLEPGIHGYQAYCAVKSMKSTWIINEKGRIFSK